jgi:hypothetical protein
MFYSTEINAFIGSDSNEEVRCECISVYNNKEHDVVKISQGGIEICIKKEHIDIFLKMIKDCMR